MEKLKNYNIRIPAELWRRLMYLKADGKIKALSSFMISATEEKAKLLEKEKK